MSMIGNLLAVTQSELDALYADSSIVPDFIYDEEQSEETVDVDKAWHAIHFVLTGGSYEAEGPIGQAILGGVQIGDEDVGYGPARGLSSAEVKNVALALGEVSEEVFRAKFDPAALNGAEIYPQIWDEGQEALDYVTENFLEVKRFYQNAAEKNKAAVLFIN